MVIGPRSFGPVVSDQGHIQIPTLAGSPSGFNGSPRMIAQGKGRQTGRAAETFLRGAVANIDVPVIDVDRYASQRGDGIDEEESAMFTAELGDRFKRLPDACRSLGLHDRHGLHRA